MDSMWNIHYTWILEYDDISNSSKRDIQFFVQYYTITNYRLSSRACSLCIFDGNKSPYVAEYHNRHLLTVTWVWASQVWNCYELCSVSLGCGHALLNRRWLNTAVKTFKISLHCTHPRFPRWFLHCYLKK